MGVRLLTRFKPVRREWVREAKRSIGFAFKDIAKNLLPVSAVLLL